MRGDVEKEKEERKKRKERIYLARDSNHPRKYRAV